MTTDHLPIQSVERVRADQVHSDGSPLDPNLPKDYAARFLERVKDPAFADTVFAHVANGGTLISLAEAWGVRHSDIAGFISEHPTFKERYAFALTSRDEWEKERCLQELRAIMAVDIRDAYNPDGTLKNVRDLSTSLAAALQSVETDELFEGVGDQREIVGYTKKVKFWDKAKAIELFMKKHGLLIERKQIEVRRSLEDLLTDSRAPRVVDAVIVQPDNADIKKAEATGGTGEMVSKNPSA